MVDPGQDFLAALRSEPDDATRQVYADWLADRGDERGEYLRIELAMANESPFVPRYWELKERRNELRTATDPAWLEAVGYPTYYTPMFGTIPDDRLARWRLVDRFIDFWRDEPLTAASGATEDEITQREAELGVTFPAALREWYLLAGRRVDVWTGQDTLLRLEKLEVRESGLVIRAENQWVELWGVLPADCEAVDPPVHRLTYEPGPDCSDVTSFALQQLVFESVGGTNSWYTDHGSSIRDWCAAELSPTSLPSSYWVLDLHFFEDRDLLLMDSRGDGFAWLATRNQKAFASIEKSIQVWFDEC